jgi:hypothetical protein
MKKIALYIFVFALAFSCKKDDEKVFPIEPYIEFKSLKFGKGIVGNWDSLNVEFYFRDGDADLGLDESYKEPYNYRNYFFKLTGKKYSGELASAKISDLITYKDKRTKNLDSLPSFAKPYNCTNWELARSTNGLLIDTVYYQANPNYYNLFVDYYILSAGNWDRFDFDTVFPYPNCTDGGVNGRFPSPENFQSESFGPFLLNRISTKEGVLTYSMKSFGLDQIFSSKKIKLKVRIQDRSFHKSNEIETSEIQF